MVEIYSLMQVYIRICIYNTLCMQIILCFASKGYHNIQTRGGGGKLLPIHPLKWNPNDVPQLEKRSAKVLPANLCTDHAHYVKIHRSTVLRRNKNMAVEGGTVSHYYILIIRKFIDFMSLFIHSVWFSFPVKQFSFAEFGICKI